MRWRIDHSVLLGVLVTLFAAAGHASSRIESFEFRSRALGRPSSALVYLPSKYDSSAVPLPVLYLLHGRGDNQRAWLEARDVLDALIEKGRIPPVIAILPDAPSSRRASYYIDSQFQGAAGLPAGEAVETALAEDLVNHVDRHYRTRAERGARVVAGYSMGGFGAVRFAFAHADLFGAAIVLSPALYLDLPAEDSSMRAFGAFGQGGERFVPALYRQLSQPWTGRGPASPPVRVFLAVGDDEPVRNDQGQSLTSDAADLHQRLRRVPGVEVEFRVYDGGHDWPVWREGVRAGLVWLFFRRSPLREVFR